MNKQELAETLTDLDGNMRKFNKYSQHWEQAFFLYNKANDKDKCLGFGCSACAPKVWKWLKN
jgi:hypothetical protein